MTKQEYEEYLNTMISEAYSYDKAFASFGYLSNRFEHVFYNCKVGSLIRKKDPILFNVGFNEFVCTHRG